MKILLLAALASFAAAESRPTFDVASLKPSPPPEGDRININLGGARHGVVTLSNACLADCLRFAYSITNNEQIDGPDWIKFKDVRFDIEGKAPPDTPLPRLREMLQTLLVERFHLQYHLAPKVMSYIALAPAKSGPKLPESKDETASAKQPMIPGRIVSPSMTMATLVTLLSRFLGETVLDQTGLTGWYEVRLEWTPDPPANADPEPGPTVFSAIESQLGLKLERRKGPLDVMVIDHADRVPAGN